MQYVSLSPAIARIDAVAVPMARFADVLSETNEVGRPVVDKTGFTDLFDIHLEYAPDTPAFRGPGPVGPSSQPLAQGEDTASASPIFAALREQLGLRLRPLHAPVPVVVIDHVEHPTPN